MRFIKSFLTFVARAFLYGSVLLLSWILCLYLRSDIAPPRAKATALEWEKAKSQSYWLDKSEHPAGLQDKSTYGINHIFLKGTPFERGLAWGSLSGDRIYRQEKMLVDTYSQIIEEPLNRKLFETGIMALFEGLEEKLEPWMLEEMWGVSQSGSHDFDFLASSYSRQLAYHGIHEVGQMFVDFAPLAGACTFVSYPLKSGNWVVGRTFDFEGGRIFDEEKVIKWVTPETGYKYVSVIWTGMVGAVSGVNEKGIYVSINAAGSTDMNLRGLPSTLLVTKVLQNASNIEEALSVFRDNDIMITDIFMVLDSKSQRLFRVEKSAAHLDMTEVKGATAVTNHLISQDFEKDDFNRMRRENFTSVHRLKRAQSLLDEMKSKNLSSSEAVNGLLRILRDKGQDENGKALHLGNRRAIDALIASHGVIYDSAKNIFYVSEGPSMVGGFRAYDLQKTFQAQKPVELPALPKDQVTLAQYNEVQQNVQKLKEVATLYANEKCSEADKLLSASPFEHVEYYLALAQIKLCVGNKEAAKLAAIQALKLSPPHKDVELYLQRLAK